MALRILHPCDYGFQTSNIRILGSSVSGGRSLSGIEDMIQTDGGGYRAVDLSGGTARTREQNMAIRALVDEVGTTQAMIVLLCAEKHFQPVNSRPSLSMADWNKPLADDAPDKGAAFTVVADAALRATSLTIAGNSERPIIGGELFSINNPTWGWRVHRITSMQPSGSNFIITFSTPLREAITAETPLEFDTPRCQMRFAQAPDLPTDQGRRTPLTLTLIEDMRKPPA
jgi:hypothetical protein